MTFWVMRGYDCYVGVVVVVKFVRGCLKKRNDDACASRNDVVVQCHLQQW